MNNHIVHNISNARTIASVVVDKALFSFDIAFDYILPENCDVVVGQRVVVPFGKGGKKRVGLIKAIRKDVPDNRLKEIFCLVNDGIILN